MTLGEFRDAVDKLTAKMAMRPRPPRMHDFVESDSHLRTPFKGGVKIRLGDKPPFNRVPGTKGHIGYMTPKQWEGIK